MTNPNIPPEIADSPAKWKSDDRVCTRWDLCPLAGQLHSHSPTPAPAPVRISPEVRETILLTLRRRLKEKQDHLLKTSFAAMEWPARERKVRDVQVAIQFVEALP